MQGKLANLIKRVFFKNTYLLKLNIPSKYLGPDVGVFGKNYIKININNPAIRIKTKIEITKYKQE